MGSSLGLLDVGGPGSLNRLNQLYLHDDDDDDDDDDDYYYYYYYGYGHYTGQPALAGTPS